MLNILYNLKETQELMDYYGDMVAWDGILELYKRTKTSPKAEHFLVAKSHQLKVIDKSEFIIHMMDGWRCELDCRVLFDNNLVSYPVPEQSEEQTFFNFFLDKSDYRDTLLTSTTNNGDKMNVGTVVRYSRKYVTDPVDGSDWIGLVIDSQSGGLRFLVQWNNGMRLWRHKDVLEVICQ